MQRYMTDYSGGPPEEDPDGEWVRWEDVEHFARLVRELTPHGRIETVGWVQAVDEAIDVAKAQS